MESFHWLRFFFNLKFNCFLIVLVMNFLSYIWNIIFSCEKPQFLYLLKNNPKKLIIFWIVNLNQVLVFAHKNSKIVWASIQISFFTLLRSPFMSSTDLNLRWAQDSNDDDESKKREKPSNCLSTLYLKDHNMHT